MNRTVIQADVALTIGHCPTLPHSGKETVVLYRLSSHDVEDDQEHQN